MKNPVFDFCKLQPSRMWNFVVGCELRQQNLLPEALNYVKLVLGEVAIAVIST